MERLRIVSGLRAVFCTLLLGFLVGLASAARVSNPSIVPAKAVLLSKISSLTLRSGKFTSSRRVSPVPQLRCVGPPSICALYDVDVLRCRNDGADYDENNIQWTCSASLPEEFRLGSTEVSCEGYESSDDPYVLKGSCGVEYRLVLTDAGERKYGLISDEDAWPLWRSKGKWEKLGTYAFWLFFVGVVGAMVLSAFGCLRGEPRRLGAAGGRPGWGGDGGSGGGGADSFDSDPPPPYSDSRPSSKPYVRPSSSRGGNRAGEEQWRPGFWTGAGAGAAAGYLLNNRNRTSGSQFGGNSGVPNRSGWFSGRRDDAGEGTSRSNAGPSYSSSRYESTGFGSSSRR